MASTDGTALFALRTNVHAWKSPFCKQVDELLLANGAALLDVPWDACQLYRSDRDHFTWRGYQRFAAALAAAGTAAGWTRVHLIADSTIDFHNWRDGARTDRASQLLRRRFARRGIALTVDAVCGSGFVARRRTREDFGTRARRDAARTPTVLLVGGWNDARETVRSVEVAVRRLAGALQRRLGGARAARALARQRRR